MVEIFSVPAFFIVFRETLEASIILSVMLALLNKIVEDEKERRRMKRQVWAGVMAAAALCVVAAAVFLSLYYTVAKNAWEESESLWEGILGLVAVILITIMALTMSRVVTWREKWERKLTKVTQDALNAKQADVEQSKRSKYALFLIPFTVVIREGVEAVIFLGGIGLQGSGTAYPIAAVTGCACGVVVGYLLYQGGNHVAFKYFFGASTLLLLVIAAGLFAGSVHEFEEYTDNEHFLWQLSCCDPESTRGFWPLLNAVVGWRNEATRGTLSAYIMYWVFVVAALLFLRIRWRRQDGSLRLQRESELSSAPPPV